MKPLSPYRTASHRLVAAQGSVLAVRRHHASVRLFKPQLSSVFGFFEASPPTLRQKI